MPDAGTYPPPAGDPRSTSYPGRAGDPAGTTYRAAATDPPGTYPPSAADPSSSNPFPAAELPGTYARPRAGLPTTAVVKGRVQVKDYVIDKVAALAAAEVPGVANPGGAEWERQESRQHRGGISQQPVEAGARDRDAGADDRDAGARARGAGACAPGLDSPAQHVRTRTRLEERQAWIDVVIAVDYGVVVIDVANLVKANVARAVNHMLGLRVAEVNVTVDDVELPRRAAPAATAVGPGSDRDFGPSDTDVTELDKPGAGNDDHVKGGAFGV